MRRVLITGVVLIAALIAGPPLVAPLAGWNDFSGALPEAGRSVEISPGVRLNVLESGAGSPVVLVHGLPGSAYDWKPLPDRLAAIGRRAIHYDRIGYGHSSRRISDDYTYEANARELIALLDALAIDRATLVGWSYGGGVVQVAASLAPERVEHLVLVGSVGPDMERHEPSIAERILFAPPVVRWSFAAGFPARFNTTQISTAAFSGTEAMPDWWVDQALALISLEGTGHTWLREGALGDVSVLRPEEITAPALIAHGSDDRLVDLSVGQNLHQRLPRSDLLVVRDGSHMLPITHADLLARRIAALGGARQ
jgi:pimeloyl-ACP methyl ester carboxylesterase